MTAEKLVQVLTKRHHYGLAKSVCEYLRLPLDSVLIEWAITQVKLGQKDERELCESIVQKLSIHEGISYSPIAKEAYKAGRIDLATKAF